MGMIRKFITFEGIDGCGKSTQANLLYEYFASEGTPALLTKEPGGGERGSIGEKLREILLSKDSDGIALETEVYLYAADRAEHVREVIRPALAAGKVVISDRFLDSSLAYQGASGFDIEQNLAINAPALSGLMPDLTILLRTSPAAIKSRNEGKQEDRIEARDSAYHEKVAEFYDALAERFAGRFAPFDAALPAQELHKMIVERCKAL